MSTFNFKDFLTSGACLQTGADTFKVLIGPFKPYSLDAAEAAESTTFLYRAKFWDFLATKQSSNLEVLLEATSVVDLHREDFIRLLLKEETRAPEVVWGSVQETGFKQQFEWSFKLFNLIGNIRYFILNALKKFFFKNFGNFNS